MGVAATAWHLQSWGWGRYSGGETLRTPPPPPPDSLIVEPNKQKPFHCGELALVGALRPLSILNSAELPRLRMGEGQATFPFVNTLPGLTSPFLQQPSATEPPNRKLLCTVLRI